MSLKIVLDSPPYTAYRLGSIISGYVELVDKKQHRIESVTLFFDGQCKVEIIESNTTTSTDANGQPQTDTTHSTFRSKGMYFSHTFSLDLASTQVAAVSKAWPFQIKVPEYAEEVSEQQIQLHHANTFAMELPWKGSHSREPHPLPSTFNFHSGSGKSLNASVEYELKAVLTRPKDSYVLFSGDLKTEQKIIIIGKLDTPVDPIRTLPFETRTQVRTVHSLLLLPNRKDGHLSLREKAKSLFNKSSLPSVTFRISISTPRTIFLGSPSKSPVPFLISLTRVHLTEDERHHPAYADEKIPLPTVKLSSLRLQLFATTFARSVGGKRTRERTVQKLTSFDIWGGKHISGKEDFPIAFTGQSTDLGAQLHIAMADITQSKDAGKMAVVPEFSTYNIARTYALAWKIVLDVAGEKVKWEETDGTACPVRLC